MERNENTIGFDTIIGFDIVDFNGLDGFNIDSHGRISLSFKGGYSWAPFPFTSGTCVFSEKPEDQSSGEIIKQSFLLSGLKDTYLNWNLLDGMNRNTYAVRIKYKDGNLIVGGKDYGVKFNVERDNQKGRMIKISFERIDLELARWENVI